MRQRSERLHNFLEITWLGGSEAGFGPIVLQSSCYLQQALPNIRAHPSHPAEGPMPPPPSTLAIPSALKGKATHPLKGHQWL